ncbi:MAG: glycosyltransferase family 2 protein [Opitutus sp.]|nr:glycosyltransferase family 2 protein [Opitutus sp.]
MTELSVIIPTHNPDRVRLQRCLEGLARQTLAPERWELVVVDNDSLPAVTLPTHAIAAPVRIVRESERGLTPARLRGFSESRGSFVVLVDDDNVLCPDYLEKALARFAQHPNLGALGGPVEPEWDVVPEPWVIEFSGLLALHEHGPDFLLQRGGADALWPRFAPVGAGLCIRRAALRSYLVALETSPERLQFDRRGASLASGGDNDLVFTVLHAGWDIGYDPALVVKHLIPERRTRLEYLAELNESIQHSWVRVLHLHKQCPWRPIPRWTVPLRSARAWIRYRAWRSPARYVRWRGARGHFRGQADIRNA